MKIVFIIFPNCILTYSFLTKKRKFVKTQVYLLFFKNITKKLKAFSHNLWIQFGFPNTC